MPRLAWNALVLAAVFALVAWRAGFFPAAASVVAAALAGVAFRGRR